MQFVDTIAVPLALILLGASFARIKVPRPLSRLPIMAMLLVTLVKMVVLPVIDVAIGYCAMELQCFWCCQGIYSINIGTLTSVVHYSINSWIRLCL